MPTLPLQTPFVPENILLSQSIQSELNLFKTQYGNTPLEEEKIVQAEKSLHLLHEKALQLFQNEYANLSQSLLLSHLLRLDIFFNDYATMEFLHTFIEALQYDLDDFDLWHIHHNPEATPASLKGYWTTLIKFVDILPKYGLLSLKETNQIKKRIRTNKRNWIQRMERLDQDDQAIKDFLFHSNG